MKTTILCTDYVNGKNYYVKHSESLLLSPAYSHFLRGYAELVDMGYSQGITTWNDFDCEAIFINIDSGEIVASSVFSKKDLANKKLIWLESTFINEEHRKLGLYKTMHRHIEKRARELGAKKIASTVSIKNADLLVAGKSIGLEPEFYLMGKYLK